jgi:hypothetical protein
MGYWGDMDTEMRDPLQHIRDQPGYREYQDTAAQAPPSRYPWGTLLANVGGIAAAHTAGYISAGTLANMLASSRVGERFSRLSPTAQRNAVGQAVSIAGSVGVVATGLAHIAGQMRIAEEVSRLERERTAAPNEKVASVYLTYERAFRDLL